MVANPENYHLLLNSNGPWKEKVGWKIMQKTQIENFIY